MTFVLVLACDCLAAEPDAAKQADAKPTAAKSATTKSAPAKPTAGQPAAAKSAAVKQAAGTSKTATAKTPLVGVAPVRPERLRPERLRDADVAQLSRAALAYPVSGKILRYAERLVKQYDANDDGRLESDEWEKMHGDPKTIAADRDGVITVEQLARYIARYGRAHRLQLMLSPAVPPAPTAAEPPLFQPAAKGSLPALPTSALPESMTLDEPEEDPDAAENDPDAAPDAVLSPEARRAAAKTGRVNQRKFYTSPRSLPPGVPQWFLLRDADGDGQLTLAEFALTPSPADLTEFSRYDANRDGIITPDEVLNFAKPLKPIAAKPSVVAPVVPSRPTIAPGVPPVAPKKQ